MNRPTIRSARPEDAERIFQLICQLASFERARDAVRTSPLVLAHQLALAAPPFECLLCETGPGAIVGFALFFTNYSTWEGSAGLHLEDLYVDSAERGKGYGRALFEEVCRVTLARGYPRLEWAALDWNEGAIRFYRSFDAAALDEWTTFRLSGEALKKAGTTKVELDD